MTSEVLTLATLSAAVSSSVRKVWKDDSVGGHAFQDEVDLAVQHVALAHERPGAAARLEGGEVRFGLADEAHHREDLHLEAQRAGIDLGVIAPDVAGFLERADPPQAGRCRDADPSRKLDVRHAAVGLKLGENLAVDRIQLVAGHARVPFWFSQT